MRSCSSAMRLSVLLALFVVAAAKTGPKTTSAEAVSSGGTGSNPKTKSTGTAGHHGPYEGIGAMLKDGKKKGSFFTLLKKLREVKNSDQPEVQKNSTRKALNVDMQNLLGADVYAKYQAVHRKQAQNLHTLRKDTVAPKKSPALAKTTPAGSTGGTPSKKSSSGGTSKKKKPTAA